MQNRPDQSPVSTTDEPIFELGPSPLEVVWEKHKMSILVGASVVIVGLVGFFGAMAVSHSNRIAAMDALAAANNAETLREVISKFPKSVEAGNASLLLSALLRDEKNPAEATQVLEAFLKSPNGHPLAPLALVGLSGIAAQSGDSAAAKAYLQRVATEFPESFAVPFALLSEAEMALASGDRSAALAGLQGLSRQHPSSVAGNAAQNTLMALESLLSDAATPAPPVTPGSVELPAQEAVPPAMQVIDVDSDPGI
jgi:predicted negative regulator of RcsB-dependent stress response